MAPQLVTQPHPLAWTFSDRVRKLRKVTRLGQEEFAEAIGVPSGTYSGWEASPTAQPRNIVAVANRIEHVFGDRYGATAAWVLGLENDGGRTPDGDPAAAWYAPRDSNPEPADSTGDHLDNVRSLADKRRQTDQSQPGRRAA